MSYIISNASVDLVIRLLHSSSPRSSHRDTHTLTAHIRSMLCLACHVVAKGCGSGRDGGGARGGSGRIAQAGWFLVFSQSYSRRRPYMMLRTVCFLVYICTLYMAIKILMAKVSFYTSLRIHTHTHTYLLYFILLLYTQTHIYVVGAVSGWIELRRIVSCGGLIYSYTTWARARIHNV